MLRAMSARISAGGDGDDAQSLTLPVEFQPRTPLLSGISNSESRQPGKCPTFAVNWLLGNEQLEVITTMRGKTEQDKPSQLCKFEMFKLYIDAMSKLRRRADMRAVDVQLDHYGDVKAAYSVYQEAKRAFSQRFQTANMGFWVNKPHEHDAFSLSDSLAAMEAVMAAMQQSLQQMRDTSAPLKAAARQQSVDGDVLMTSQQQQTGGDVTTVKKELSENDVSYEGMKEMFDEAIAPKAEGTSEAMSQE